MEVLFKAAAKVLGPNAYGVMLTGMGVDGLRGFTRLKQRGAHIVAQDQLSSVVYGMPKAIADAGLADEVLSLDSIGAYLKQVVG